MKKQNAKTGAADAVAYLFKVSYKVGSINSDVLNIVTGRYDFALAEKQARKYLSTLEYRDKPRITSIVADGFIAL